MPFAVSDIYSKKLDAFEKRTRKTKHLFWVYGKITRAHACSHGGNIIKARVGNRAVK